MSLKEPKNKNYCATVVRLNKFVELDNCDNVKGALIFGNQVIVGKDAMDSEWGLFFPLETALSKEILSARNLYRDNKLNKDETKRGFFEDNGRVKAVKFRGHKSEGFFLPLMEFVAAFGGVSYPFCNGDTFDEFKGIPICHKYEVPVKARKGPGTVMIGKKLTQLIDLVVPNQFRFQPDTENLRKNAAAIQPGDYISVSDKLHGTSVVIANVLVERKLNWLERLAKRLGVKVKEDEYGLVVSSRRVLKTVAGEAKSSPGFYSFDIWGKVGREEGSKLPHGFTIYGEIVGWTPDGAPIQNGYTYSQAPRTCQLYVYRATMTNESGQVVELGWHQLGEFCEKYGFKMVPTMWYGKAAAFLGYEDYDISEIPAKIVSEIERLFVAGRKCAYNPGMPAEGVVVRIDRLDKAEAYKLKSFEFLERESKMLDKGEADIESEESSDTAS